MPSLYTWNGDRYVFVTHLMTRSAIGALTETGAPAWPDAANDFVKIRGDQLRMRDGKFEVRVVEELWDAVYMDKWNCWSSTTRRRRTSSWMRSTFRRPTRISKSIR